MLQAILKIPGVGPTAVDIRFRDLISIGVVAKGGPIRRNQTIEWLVAVTVALMRRRPVADIVVSVAFVRLIRMCRGGEAIESVVGIVVCAVVVDHLRDVVQAVELVLKVGECVCTFCVR